MKSSEAMILIKKGVPAFETLSWSLYPIMQRPIWRFISLFHGYLVITYLEVEPLP